MNIPQKHLYHLLVCNTNYFANKQLFYKVKKKILYQYAVSDGFALQIVKKECWTCDGTGKYKRTGDVCWSCLGDGIYSTRHYLLQRFLLNNQRFYVPIDQENFTLTGCDEEIQGIIKHEKVEGNPLQSLVILLYLYDKAEFFNFTMMYLKQLRTKAKWKFIRNFKKHKRLINGWLNYLNPKQKSNLEYDELPF